MRELAGIGHQHAVRQAGQDRRDDDAGVGDDHHAEALPAACAGRRGRAAPRHGGRCRHGSERQACARRSGFPGARIRPTTDAGCRSPRRRSRLAPAAVDSRACASAIIASLTSITVSAGRPAERRCEVWRFRRHAGDVEQADRAGRSGRRAERLERILARMAGDAGDHADRIADLAAVEAAEDRPGDAPSRGRTAAIRRRRRRASRGGFPAGAGRSPARGR